MALQSIRYGGGVWRQQEETRLALQTQLQQRDTQLCDAHAEIDRVHAQCVELLQDNSELTASLSQAQMHLRRRDEELHAAKQNVAELMALLTNANEDRARLEKERSATTTVLDQTREQQKLAHEELELLQKQYTESDQEAQRLRDLLYETQECSEYQQQEITQLQRQVQVLVRSNQTKDCQVLALIRERDAHAQKLAQYRCSRVVVTTNISNVVLPDTNRTITWTENAPTKEQQQEQSVQDSVVVSTTTTGSTGAHALVEFEKQKQKLRNVALQAKARFARERETNCALQKRVAALEKSHEELLVRFRGASRAKTVTCSSLATQKRSSSIQAA